MGCLVVTVLLILVGVVLYHTIPVFLDKVDFEDQLERIASEGGARNWDTDSVRAQVVELARIKDFDTSPESIRVNKRGRGAGGEIRIDVRYWRTVNFARYNYTFRFESRAKSFVGTL